MRRSAQQGELREFYRKFILRAGRDEFRGWNLADLQQELRDLCREIYRLLWAGADPQPVPENLARGLCKVAQEEGIERSLPKGESASWFVAFDRFASRPWQIMGNVLGAPARLFGEVPEATFEDAFVEWSETRSPLDAAVRSWLAELAPAPAHDEWLWRLADRMSVWGVEGWDLLFALYTPHRPPPLLPYVGPAWRRKMPRPRACAFILRWAHDERWERAVRRATFRCPDLGDLQEWVRKGWRLMIELEGARRAIQSALTRQWPLRPLDDRMLYSSKAALPPGLTAAPESIHPAHVRTFEKDVSLLMVRERVPAPPLRPRRTEEGPVAGCRFAWRGREVSVQPLAWRLIDFLWKRPALAASVEETGGFLWGGDGWKEQQLSSATNRANKALLSAGCALRISKKGGQILLS